MDKIYSALGVLVLLTCCSVEQEADPVVIVSPPPPLYPVTTATAIVLKKRVLPHNRTEYHARLATGQEINFTTDSLPHYQIGDIITLPRE